MDAKKIVLVEDDALLASLLTYRLKKGGYEVDHMKDGKEVKEKLPQMLPDIIVSDIMMPYLSGLELIDFVRNHLESSIPIIIISSAGNEENVLTAFELGANDFIAKPVSPSELLVRVAKELKNVISE